jgi:ribosome maturation factor RimP
MNSADITRLVAPIAAGHGLEIDRIEVSAAGRRSVVQIFLDGDGPAGLGPSLDQIAETTRGVSIALDTSDISKGRAYTLEVSSRGVGRPLTEPKHYRRNRGRLVELTTDDGPLTGRIVGSDDDSVEIDVDGHPRQVLLTTVSKALVQVELNRPVAGEADEEGQG